MHKKQDVIFEACEDALAEGGENLLSKVFSIDTRVRRFENASYATLRCTAGGKGGFLKIRFKKEVHCRQIAPSIDTEVVRINVRRPADRKIQKRNRKPAPQFQKYKIIEEGEEPKKENESVFYKAFLFVNEYFRAQITKWLQNNEIVEQGSHAVPPGVQLVPNMKIGRKSSTTT